MENEQNSTLPDTIPCFLCGDFQNIYLSKSEKPYFICDDCGIQVFIRKENGILRLKNLIQDPDLRTIYLNAEYLKNSKIFRIKERIKLLKDRISNFEIILTDKNEIELEKALKSKLSNLETQYLNILKNN